MLRACGDLWIHGWRASRGAQTDYRPRVGWKYAKCFSEVPRAAATSVKSLQHRGPFGFAQGRLRGAEGERAQGGTCRGRRSAERLSYWPEFGRRVLTRREQEMPRSFAVNNNYFLMAARVV